jgi:hypothetical protein
MISRHSGRGLDLRSLVEDEMEISLAPILLGGGEWDGVGALPELKLVRTVAAPGVTHFKFARR